MSDLNSPGIVNAINGATERDPRVQRMIDDPAAYFAAARTTARKEAIEATRREAELRRAAAKAGPWETAAAWLLLIGLSWGAVAFVAYVVAAIVRGLS